MLSRDQFKLHGATLARAHQVTLTKGPEQLLPRLNQNEQVLTETCNLLISALKANFRIAPAGDWLLDNFYLIKEQIHTARKHLPKGYSRELPRLTGGSSSGLPRVYEIAVETVTHGDGRVDPKSLSIFIDAYQQVTTLKLGELWAIPIMLRLALIENLRQVGEHVAEDLRDRELADSWAEKMTTIAEKDPKNLIMVVAAMAHSSPNLSSAFVAELVRRLQGQGMPLALPLTWIEQSLMEVGLSIEMLVQSETQQQAANQVSISNCIASLRLLGAIDWQEFVEARSHVEHILCKDPAGIYRGMDFTTRDFYRHVIEKTAKYSGLQEEKVAEIAIEMAGANSVSLSSDAKSAHVGFFLIDKGLSQLEEKTGTRLPMLEALLRWFCRFPLFLYLGFTFLITAFLTAHLLKIAIAGKIMGLLVPVLGITIALCTSNLAISIVNWLVTLLVKPHPLPRMNFAKGIPAEYETLVIVPTMLSSARGIEHLAEALEVRFLANLDEHLHFGLITDFSDAAEQNLPGDAELVNLAQKKIEELNEKYRGKKAGSFFLFHRHRQWNPSEQIWMGYERKRGKLAALNSLLRGGAKDLFSHLIGNIQILPNIKYVITLDTDTGLPRDAARQFIAAMAHPLNRPVYDAKKQRVTEGYTILQPQVGVSLPGTSRSRYAGIHGSDSGVDPYTRVVSDIYQDVFGEGSFTGKGIYDVDAFELVLHDRLPENRILSHDLIEGCYSRSGLLSDVMLYEEYPARYSADVSRWHRWTRGDWQIASWLFRHVPGPNGKKEKNPLTLLSQWKIFDNLRRSLVPPAFTLMLIFSWTVLSPAWLWTTITIGILMIQSLVASVIEMYRKPEEVIFRQHLVASLHTTALNMVRMIFSVICLPYEAFFSIDAIFRTLWRLKVSNRLLLEWNPSGNIDPNSSLYGSFRSMWFASTFSLGVYTCLTLTRPAVSILAQAILAIWFISPAITWLISLPLSRREPKLSDQQKIFLRKIARRTWAFFETFVVAADNWLPPDNYQENRPVTVAHRTSPTNMGISLLANLAAYDFGYITAAKVIERSADSLQTMTKMERHRGHFYNWYDTETLRPLTPLYVSSVDSGNLVGFLLTLRAGLMALPSDRIVSGQIFAGLTDTMAVIAETSPKEYSGIFAAISGELAEVAAAKPTRISSFIHYLKKLTRSVDNLVVAMSSGSETETKWWAAAFSKQCHDALDDLIFQTPWAEIAGFEGKSADSGAIDAIPSLAEIASFTHDHLPLISQMQANCTTPEKISWLEKIKEAMIEAGNRARKKIAAIDAVTGQLNKLVQIDYGFLYDKTCHLLAIGFNVSDNRLDSSLYDLLASEARLTTFVAIAQGQLEQNSWFAMGRLLSNVGGDPVLLSWNGSMFEYLMPLLIMPAYDNTLLNQTYQAVVDRQIKYGRQCGVPWGISESGYNMVDAHINYQYRAFGVPGLGLKRGLSEDLVIAPYASVMALMVSPQAACQNMQRLVAEGFSGKFGLFEAIDFTPARQLRGQSGAVIQSFMAHHQGMSLLALAYTLLNQPMQRRFESEPIFQATSLLLQECIPRNTVYYPHANDLDLRLSPDSVEAQVRVFDSTDSAFPEVQLLSNRRYHVMITSSGGGYSRWQNFAVTRWREDTTCDNWGSFCYIRDLDTLEFWSNSFQPTLKKPENYEVVFSEGRAEFRRRDRDIDVHTEVAVSPEDDIELRRMSITNRSRRQRKIELTSYAEVVLAPQTSDELHPAFSNLFVQTEILHERRAILCTRRPRSNNEPVLWMFNLMATHGVHRGEVTYETDRMKFIGRGNTVGKPKALTGNDPLSGSDGSVLDPVVVIRHRLVLEPGQTARIDMVTGVCDSKEGALSLVEKYQDRQLTNRVFELAWTHSQVTLQQLNTTEADAQHFCCLAGSIIYANSSLRAEPGIIIRNNRRQSSLWGYAISGDLPIVLLRIRDSANIALVRQMIQAHTYWRSKGLVVDLLIWNEDHASYQQFLQDQIMGLIAAGVEASTMDRPGGIFLRLFDQISAEDRILFQTVARAIISDSCGLLSDQLYPCRAPEVTPPSLKVTRTPFPKIKPARAPLRQDLNFFNGVGGFTPDGKEYVITTAPGQITPAPWVNILANSRFGTVVSENGLAYTWADNAHEYRLTPWNNDPVCDAAGEAFYLRDEERGHVWSPMPLPCRGDTPYTTRHGFGYSVFEHAEYGIRSEVWVYVALNSAVKFSVIKLRNESGQNRRLSATGYVEWVLGDLRQKTASQVITLIDPSSDAFLARNPYNSDFPNRVAFFDVNDTARTFTGDRGEFIGRNGTFRKPAALNRTRLSNKIGAALDPCAAIQTSFELINGQEREIVFMLGVGENYEAAIKMLRQFRGSTAARTELEGIWNHWAYTLGAVQVETPDKALNIMANGWLIYQTMACRMWARSGFYQSGGAFGFRDQLQDVMALIHTSPQLARDHLLLCASRQFLDGDVQHWWHPPQGRGVRTRCSDDYLWLVMATCRYVQTTGDTGVLDDAADFLDGRQVNDEEDSYYDTPAPGGNSSSLYEHCVRAITRGLRFGSHGLPLIGSGDWNDGMDLVGRHGKGESVWLAFFFYDILVKFSALARQRLDMPFADRCVLEAARLRENIESNAWDGGWYRRAFFDDGTPLGSVVNDECSIDSISQSWSILSGAGGHERGQLAMAALYKQLVDRNNSMVLLLHPPLDKSNLNPGYIKGYVPGVRENGGQYTHGAIWATMAFAATGDRQKAWELLGMLNPINHSRNEKEMNTYKVEPYVMAADVYGLWPHQGRGGWTWYTGSAAWMYRLIIESLLGLKLTGARLEFAPCLPVSGWESFKIHYRYRDTVYHLTFRQIPQQEEKIMVEVNGQFQPEKFVSLEDDRQEHHVEVRISTKAVF